MKFGAGQTIERYRQTPYGTRTVLNDDFTVDGDGVSDVAMDVGHQGLKHDAETGLIYNRARYLHNSLGRFTAEDPLGTAYQDGMNLYEYVRGNPNLRNDHAGEESGRSDVESPWALGWEWMTGNGPRDREFGQGHPLTDQLRDSWKIEEVAKRVTSEIAAKCVICDTSPISGRDAYSLAGWQGVPEFAREYSAVATLGLTGNLTVAYLGSFSIEYKVTNILCKDGVANIEFRVFNSSTLASGIRPPVIGYTDWWKNGVTPILNAATSQGPLSKTTQVFKWKQRVTFEPNCKCEK